MISVVAPLVRHLTYFAMLASLAWPLRWLVQRVCRRWDIESADREVSVRTASKLALAGAALGFGAALLFWTLSPLAGSATARLVSLALSGAGLGWMASRIVAWLPSRKAAAFGLFGGAMSAFVWLPALHQLGEGSARVLLAGLTFASIAAAVTLPVPNAGDLPDEDAEPDPRIVPPRRVQVHVYRVNPVRRRSN